MDTAILIDILKQVAGGLGIFLIGMRFMSEGMQAVAGPRLSRWISAATNNRYLAVVSGIGVTCVIQSSSATTVMVVGFVNSGLMSLMQAIGVIFGANIGTTISAWIMSLDLSKMGPILLGAAALPYLFAKRERTRNIGMALLGVGMLFTGLEMMSNGFKPLRQSAAVLAWFQSFEAVDYVGVLKCALVGCLVTILVQSSTATIGITIGLAEAGLISFDSAIALVIGENLGTTVTAFFASLGATRTARRAAYAHILFNMLGVLWVTAVFHWFFASAVHLLTGSIVHLVRPEAIGPAQDAGGLVADGHFPHPRLGIAIAHSMFNIANTLVFLPFMGVFARIVTWMVPVQSAEAESADERYKPLFLDNLMLETPTLAIEQSHKEIVAMGETNLRLLEALKPLMRDDLRHPEQERSIADGEERLDAAQHAVMEFVSKLLTSNLSPAFGIEARRQLRRADEFESVSDYIRQAMKARNRLAKAGETFSPAAVEELARLHALTTSFAESVVEIVRGRKVADVPAAREMNAEVAKAVKECRSSHLNRLAKDEVTATKSVLYSDILVAYRRIKDHLLNVIDTLVE